VIAIIPGREIGQPRKFLNERKLGAKAIGPVRAPGDPRRVYSYAEAVDGSGRTVKRGDAALSWGERSCFARAMAASSWPITRTAPRGA